RMRRELRVAVVSILFGMVIGAAIVTIHASQSVESEGFSNNAHLRASNSETLPTAVAEPNVQSRYARGAKAVETIEPYPTRMVRVRKSKPASVLAGIALGQTARAQPDSGPASTGPAPPENAQDPGSPAAAPPAQSSTANAEPNVAAAGRRPSATRARRDRDDANENTRLQERRAPYWGERAYAEDGYWRGAARNWVY